MTSTPTLDAIQAAFERGQFCLAYQPIVSLEDGHCLGAEALTRWRHPDGSLIDAHAFMSVTDRTPMSGRITYWVIDTVAAELGDWLDAHPESLVAINIPPEVLGRGGLVYAAAKSGLSARAPQIVLEITERGVPDQLGLEALNRAPAGGVRIALDDMTLSGANLALLTRCHFDFVKIDHQIVSQLALGHDVETANWLNGLRALLASTDLQVIAEGIERLEQIIPLKDAGVQWGQGRYFSPPLSSQAFTQWVASYGRRQYQ